MTPRNDRLILLVCSSGGHLGQLYNLRPWWGEFERVWVTFDKPDATSLLADEEVVWAYHPTTRNLLNLLRNTWLAFKTLRRLRPAMVVSTGAAVAFPFFLAARLYGAKTTFIEVFDRLDSATMTGRLCYPLSDLFLLQWEEQKRMYPRGKLLGPLL
ncbi:MAG: PssD/Cps14F family polysaccharide biosynthesis glycosyltransferase [Actinomycetota bacterium]